MSEAELAARRPVWIALSDLFLDTDVRLSYVSIVRTLAASPYGEEELRDILQHEVAPALESNLLEVAGEWAGFDEDWVVAEISPLFGTRRRSPPLVSMEEDWQALRILLERLRALPEGKAREARADAWRRLLRLFLYKDREDPCPPDTACLREAWKDLHSAMMPQARRLARLEKGTYPTEEEILENWRRFQARCLC